MTTQTKLGLTVLAVLGAFFLAGCGSMPQLPSGSGGSGGDAAVETDRPETGMAFSYMGDATFSPVSQRREFNYPVAGENMNLNLAGQSVKDLFADDPLYTALMNAAAADPTDANIARVEGYRKRKIDEARSLGVEMPALTTLIFTPHLYKITGGEEKTATAEAIKAGAEFVKEAIRPATGLTE